MKLPFLPEAASVLASKVDALLLAVTLMTGIVAFGVVVLLVVFTIKYRRGTDASREFAPEPVRRRVRRRMEIAWIAIPLLLFIAVFGWGATLYFDHAAPPPNALEIFVVAKQWMWKLQHVTGQREIDELHVPSGIPVKLVMTAQDAIHSFFVPAFRVKQDVLPGRYTILWFTATAPGEYDLFCAEYCGTDHSRMLGKIVVLEPAQYQRWLEAHNAEPTMAMRGESLFRQLGCGGCHAAQAAVRAPPLEGLFGRQVPLRGGGTVLADDRYLRDSILLPQKEIAAGYDPVMPSFAGQISDPELLDLIAYIKSLAAKEAASP